MEEMYKFKNDLIDYMIQVPKINFNLLKFPKNSKYYEQKQYPSSVSIYIKITTIYKKTQTIM